MASIWDRVGEAFKAGAKATVDTALAPSQTTSAPTQTVYVPQQGTTSTASASRIPSWAIPAGVGGLLLLLLLRKR